MASNPESQFVKDLASKKMTVTRHFDAEVALVWLTWTEQELLDQWWAPKPWRAETKSLDFRDGGQWLYAMVGPNNERHWSGATFGKIEFQKSFELTQGSNMHICVEPHSREETKRIFEALAVGGNVTMPLQDMFFGAHFGTITDRFGINWMFNFIA